MVTPNHPSLRRLIGCLLLTIAAGVLAAGCDGDAEDGAALTTGPASAPVEPTRTVVRVVTRTVRPSVPVEPAYTGDFSTSDTLQRCRATAHEVRCVSTVSGQVVALDGAGAAYLGVDPSESTPGARPLTRAIRTPGGVRCLQSTRGVECRRGGHGFVIGDTRVVVMRGPASETFRPDAFGTHTPSADAPDPYGDLPEIQAPEVDEATLPVLTATCDEFMYREVPQGLLDLDPVAYADLDGDGDGVACDELPSVNDAASGIPDYAAPPITPADPGYPSGEWADTCQDGSCYGAPSEANGQPRTQYVAPYVRSDGTVVGGHYRSR